MIFIAQFGLIMINIAFIINYFNEKTTNETLYNIWAICSLGHIVFLMKTLQRWSTIGQFLSIISYSLKCIKPFLIVMLFVFICFSQVGMALFGGSVSERTYEIFEKKTGGSINK
jgi:hypothetical protein